MNESSLEKKRLFESDPVPKALLAMAVPTIVSQLINLVYNNNWLQTNLQSLL